MIAFPELLVKPATEAGMKVPANVSKYDTSEYPHFAVFCALQLGTAMLYPSVHFDNAKLIAGILDDKIKNITLNDCIELGIKI